MNLPHVTIITLNFNGIRDTKRCIESLKKTTYQNFHVIVVDNGSTKNEAHILNKWIKDKRFTIVRHEKNYGYTEGNNRILKDVKDKYVVLLNNDVIVTPNWLQPIIARMEEDNKIAAAQPKIRWARNKEYFDYAGASGGYLDQLGYPFTKGRIFNTIEKDKGQYDEVSDIFWASGAAMILRTNIFRKIGYFDIKFFNYMEEIDLCFRINKAGYRIVCIPQSVVFHKGAATSSKNELKKRFWEHRNNLLMITKNFELRKLLYILPLRFVLEYASLFYYLGNRRLDYAAAVILSQLSYFHLAPGILIERMRKNEPKSHRYDKQIFKKSIVFNYFILRKRTFAILHG